jgi:hypothetical protein
MKSLSYIKAVYAQEKHFKSWEHFCSVANDAMFIRAIDDVAQLFGASQKGGAASAKRKISFRTAAYKKNKHVRKACK